MSDLFRIHIPQEIASAGISTLARLTHEAEETDNDILLMQVAAVMESRSETERRVYREVYLFQWKQRMDGR